MRKENRNAIIQSLASKDKRMFQNVENPTINVYLVEAVPIPSPGHRARRWSTDTADVNDDNEWA